MQGAQLGGRGLKLPVAVAKDAAVGPGGDDFANEQVLSLLNMRLGDEAADQPGGAAFDEWQLK